MTDTIKQQEKLKHVHACMMPESQYQKSAGFDKVELSHEAAGAISLHEVSLATTFLEHNLSAPLMIAPMTGGMELGAVLNQRWARAAEHFGIAFGVGSQRLALEDERVKESFLVRRYAKTALVFANLGAGQLVQTQGVKQAVHAVSMIEADALFVHVNPVQEACQEHGDVDFSHLLRALSYAVKELHKNNTPVFVREVGFGLSKRSAQAFIDAGVDGLDCGGAGGTSWSKVEALVAKKPFFQRLGDVFGEWGIPTADSIENVRAQSATIPLIATGGVRTGLDVIKALVLGADLAGMAQPMLRAAVESDEALFRFIEEVLMQMRVTLFAMGVTTTAALKSAKQSA